jgi:hypothetical protein
VDDTISGVERMPVADISELRPIVEKYVKEMYGGKLEDLHISSAKRVDIAKEWRVEVEAEDEDNKFLFEVKIDEETGKVKTFEKRSEKPLAKARYTP